MFYRPFLFVWLVGGLLSSCASNPEPAVRLAPAATFLCSDVSASFVLPDSLQLKTILDQTVRHLQNPGDVLQTYYIAAQTCDAHPIVPPVQLPEMQPVKDARLEKTVRNRWQSRCRKIRSQTVEDLRLALKRMPPQAPYTDIHGVICLVQQSKIPVRDVVIVSDLRHDAHGINITRGFSTAAEAQKAARQHAGRLKQELPALSPEHCAGLRFTFYIPLRNQAVLAAASGGYLTLYWETLLQSYGISSIRFQPLSVR